MIFRRTPPSGLRSAPLPTPGSTPVQITLHYLNFYSADFARTRRDAKRKAKAVALTTAIIAAAISLAGAATVIFAAPWIAMVTTGLSGVIAVIAAWDGLFHHRDLWVQRSGVLKELERLRRLVVFRVALEESEQSIARDVMAELDEVLEVDHSTWMAVADVGSGASQGDSTEAGG